MKETVIIQNLKCGGCATTIRNELNKLDGISETTVNEETSEVSFISEKEDNSELLNRLDQLGYPPENTENSVVKKAMSYVSCMIGRVS